MLSLLLESDGFYSNRSCPANSRCNHKDCKIKRGHTKFVNFGEKQETSPNELFYIPKMSQPPILVVLSNIVKTNKCFESQRLTNQVKGPKKIHLVLELLFGGSTYIFTTHKV